MSELPLNLAARWGFALLGAIALVLGVLLAATEIRWATHGTPAAWLAAVVSTVVAFGGASLLRAALRGRIRTRTRK
jgi:hypothetical protein